MTTEKKKKPTNWKAIGKAFEKKCQAALDGILFKTHKAGAVVKYIPNGKGGFNARATQEDIFGAFDIIAANASVSSFTNWIQCTVGGASAIRPRKEKVEEMGSFLNLKFNILHLWVRDKEHKHLIDCHVLDINHCWFVQTINTKNFDGELKNMIAKGLL